MDGQLVCCPEGGKLSSFSANVMYPAVPPHRLHQSRFLVSCRQESNSLLKVSTMEGSMFGVEGDGKATASCIKVSHTKTQTLRMKSDSVSGRVDLRYRLQHTS
jgi:hypothetical protein